MSRMRHRLGVSAVIGLLVAVTAVTATACARQETTTIIRDPEVLSEDATTTALTPLERGALRREALRVAKAGWAAFEQNDTDAMSEYFADSIVEGFVDRYARYAAQGRERHRDYEVLFFDVTKMSADGREATVTITAIDNSYYVEPSGATTRPESRERSIQFVLVSEDGESFTIEQFIAAQAVLD